MSKRLIFSDLLCIFLLLLISFSCKKKEGKKPFYKELVWSDEFDGTNIDASKWVFQTGNGTYGWGNAEKQYYTNRTQNANVSNGHLIISANYEPGFSGNIDYTSARFRTYGKADWKYGRFEASIKIPSAAGIWPAFWMLPNTGPWPNTGEIDIMEASNENPTLWHGTIHYYCTPCSNHQYSGPAEFFNAPLSDGFHQYAVEWEPEEIKWYVDGVLKGTQTPSTTVGGAWPFDSSDNFYILLNVAVGGNFPNQNPIASQYPVTMEVDYVRVYKK